MAGVGKQTAERAAPTRLLRAAAACASSPDVPGLARRPRPKRRLVGPDFLPPSIAGFASRSNGNTDAFQNGIRPLPGGYNQDVPADRRRARRVHERLLKAYGSPRWRPTLSPLEELISTILSQNTNDTNCDRAFEALRERFPAWEAVRDAPQQAVIDAIRPAGLAPQKGPRIQRLLRQITDECGGLDLGFLHHTPSQDVYDWLIHFEGVGPKTASIVMLFSLGLPAFPVDTHVYRVTGRLGLRPPGITADQAHRVLAEAFAAETYLDAHLNLIRHGREVCHARNPECGTCRLLDLCPFGQARSAE